MKLMRCVNNHFYDGDIYSKCPHCKVVSDDPKTEKLDRFVSDLRLKNKRLKEDSLWEQPIQNDVPLSQKNEESEIQNEQNQMRNDLEREINNLNFTEKLHGFYGADEYENSGNYERQTNGVHGETLDDEGKTVRFSSRKEDAKEPLVGWLVGLNGEVYGEGFPLVTGRNYIGRGSDMDVVLRGDPSVSRNKHAVVIYDPKSRQFLIQPGESKELFYMDEKLILDTQVMKSGCELCIGETKLRFIAFCGEGFSWETYS